jgi:hypothetical protein
VDGDAAEAAANTVAARVSAGQPTGAIAGRVAVGLHRSRREGSNDERFHIRNDGFLAVEVVDARRDAVAESPSVRELRERA